MIRRPLSALCLAALFAAQASLALAAGTGPTHPNENSQAPITPGMSPGTTPSGMPPATGTDPRTQGSDMGRQGGVDNDGTRKQPTEGMDPDDEDESGSKTE